MYNFKGSGSRAHFPGLTFTMTCHRRRLQLTLPSWRWKSRIKDTGYFWMNTTLIIFKVLITITRQNKKLEGGHRGPKTAQRAQVSSSCGHCSALGVLGSPRAHLAASVSSSGTREDHSLCGAGGAQTQACCFLQLQHSPSDDSKKGGGVGSPGKLDRKLKGQCHLTKPSGL